MIKHIAFWFKTCMMKLDFQHEFEALLKQLIASTLVLANVNPVRSFRCYLCGEGHTNDYCVLERYVVETHYVENYQEPNIYFKTYNPWWKHHPNLKWTNNQCQNFN